MNTNIFGISFGRSNDFGQFFSFGSNSTVIIQHNTFNNYSSTGLNCIGIETPNIPSTISYFNISFNSFTIQNYYSQVIYSYGNRNKLVFEENDIQCPPGTDFGNSQLMLFLDSEGLGNHISYNTVHVHPNFPTILYNQADIAFFFRDFSNSTVCNNTSSENNREFLFQGKCNMTDFRRNTARTGKLIELTDWPIINDQIHAGNRFLYGIGNGTPTADIPGPIEQKKYAAFSQFRVHEVQSTLNNPKYYHPEYIDPLIIPNTSPEELWWKVETTGSPIDCPTIRGEITTLDKAILEQSSSLSSFLPEELTFLKHNLFSYLSNNPIYKSLDSRFNNWINEISDSTQIDEFYNVQNNVLSGYVSNSLNNQEWNSYHIIDSLFNLSYSDYDADSLSPSFFTNLGLINNQLVTLQNNSNSYNTERINYYSNILNDLNSITPENSNETIIKTYYRVLLESLQNGQLNATQISSLMSIASECPRKYGLFPAWANDLLPECQQLNVNCAPPSMLMKIQENNSQADGIYNLLGQKVSSLKNETHMLFNSGIYIKVINGKASKIFMENYSMPHSY
ncbi:MAG: hypothetical protein ABIP47_09840 [Saprospiraceae bacterium]